LPKHVMPMPTPAKLTPLQGLQIQKTIALGRDGRASLVQLAKAHDLCQGAGLTACSAELRAHIRTMAADHDVPHKRSGRDVLTGVISGMITHAILSGLF
jgi:hypothetical protein